MKDSNFDKLNYVDQIDYNKRLTICQYCRGIEECNKNGNYGMKPVIMYRESVNKYTLASQLCGKQQGDLQGSYAKLIKNPVKLYENDERKMIVDKLSRCKGGFLYGSAGTGKSTIMLNLAKQFNDEGKDVYFELANKISVSLRDFDNIEENMKMYQDVEILFIDDLARETMTKWVIMNIFNPILQYRIDHKMITYITCNYSLEELYKMIEKEVDKVSADAMCDRISTIGTYNLKDKNYRNMIEDL